MTDAIKTGTRVRIIGDVDCAGALGTVIEVIDGWDYPYNVEFGQDFGPFLYAADELEVLTDD